MREAKPKGPAIVSARMCVKRNTRPKQYVDLGGARPHPRAPFSQAGLTGNFVHIAKGRYQLAHYEYAPRHVIEARYLGDYKVWLEFNDGRKGVVDLSDELHGEEHTPLRNRELFSTFYLDYGLASIAWLEGADFPCLHSVASSSRTAHSPR